jgi:NitT/TauT family transport system ATP-binding protein
MSPVVSTETTLAAAATAAVEVARCSVTFVGAQGTQGPLEALRDVSLEVMAGEFVTVIGPSGCGKSTLLRLAADIVRPTSGSVRICGQPPAAARRARAYSMVFQDPALLPWRTVRENVELPLEIGGAPPLTRRAAAQQAIDLVGLSGFERARPAQLSGGMRQRTAIARALTLSPQVLLMDEPFSAVDELTRDRLNLELMDLWQRTGAAVLFVTHSIEEAVFLSDRVIVLTRRPGQVAASFTVDLPRPRTLQMKRAAATFTWTARLREALEAASR